MLVLANVSFSYQLAGGTGETQEWDVLNVEDCSWKMEMEIEDGRMGGWEVGRRVERPPQNGNRSIVAAWSNCQPSGLVPYCLFGLNGIPNGLARRLTTR